jgi:hypothetical protein
MRLALVTPTIPGSEAVPLVNLLGTLDIVGYVVVRQICNISSINLALYRTTYTSRPLKSLIHKLTHKRALAHKHARAHARELAHTHAYVRSLTHVIHTYVH